MYMWQVWDNCCSDLEYTETSIKITSLCKIKQDNKNPNSMGTIYENRLIIIVWYDKIKFKKFIWYKYKIMIVFILLEMSPLYYPFYTTRNVNE